MRGDQLYHWIQELREHIGKVIVGKRETVDMLIAALLAGGHTLLEDVPGTGKTLAAKALAKSIGGSFRRVQFTPDLLPSDLTGIHFYNQKNGEFEFRPGPVFANILLADELNRATPRTQSSLLECMEERQVTIDGTTTRLSPPFLVIATQNPVDNQGTFPLPEAQLDRFLMKLSFGYPSPQETVEMLRRFQTANPLETIGPVASTDEVLAAQRWTAAVHIEHDLLGYIARVAEATRQAADVELGVSPRGCQAWMRASQAFAALSGRDYVTPDDLKAVAVPVLAHRILLQYGARGRDQRASELIRKLLAEVEVPTEAAPGLPS